MKQSITGNKMFMKRTILPITKKIGVKRVKVKIIPPQLPDDKDKIEISFDLDKNQNDELLKLLQKKIGKKRRMKMVGSVEVPQEAFMAVLSLEP